MKNGDVRAEMRPDPDQFIPCLPDLAEPGKENEYVPPPSVSEHLPRLESQSRRTAPGHFTLQRRPIEQANGP